MTFQSIKSVPVSIVSPGKEAIDSLFSLTLLFFYNSVIFFKVAAGENVSSLLREEKASSKGIYLSSRLTCAVTQFNRENDISFGLHTAHTHLPLYVYEGGGNMA